jgi:hypothetical protein
MMMDNATMAPRLARSDAQTSRRGDISAAFTTVGAGDSAMFVMT